MNNYIILNVNGVGYNIFTDYKGAIGALVEFHIDMQVRQDSMILFGFREKIKYELFLIMLKVNGLGGKAILKIFECFDVKQLKELIIAENSDLLKQVPGIGDRIAKRIVGEIKKKDILLLFENNIESLNSSKDSDANKDESYDSNHQSAIELDIINALKKLEISDEGRILNILNSIGRENYSKMSLNDLISKVLKLFYK